MDSRTSLILNNVQSKLLQKNYSESTIKCYLDWIYRFLFFHKSGKTNEYGKTEITQFLLFLGNDCQLSFSSQNQAFNAIRFLYKEVLNISLERLSFKYRIHSSKPTILEQSEIMKILSVLSGEKWLMTALMYGSGLTVSECRKIRIKDIDFNDNFIQIANACMTRKTLFPKSLVDPLKNQIRKIESIYSENMMLENYDGAVISDKIREGSIKTSKNFKNHFLFPSKNLRINKISGTFIQVPISESYLQKIIGKAGEKISIRENVSCITFRHSFATHLIENGCDIHLVQELLGHKNIQSTMIYKDLAIRDFRNIISPLDNLLEKRRY